MGNGIRLKILIKFDMTNQHVIKQTSSIKEYVEDQVTKMIYIAQDSDGNAMVRIL